MPWDGWWHMGWMWFFWIAVIVGIVLLVRVFMSQAPRGGEFRDTPEEILKRRYAKGEIDKGEYERKLEDLRQ